MMPNDLVDLWRRCQVSLEVNMILSRSLLSLENVLEDWCCAYANFFEKCELFFPIPTCILEMLYCLGLAFPQMSPNFVRHVLALFTRAWELNRRFSCRDLLQYCQVKNQRSKRPRDLLHQRSPRISCLRWSGVMPGLKMTSQILIFLGGSSLYWRLRSDEDDKDLVPQLDSDGDPMPLFPV